MGVLYLLVGEGFIFIEGEGKFIFIRLGVGGSRFLLEVGWFGIFNF